MQALTPQNLDYNCPGHQAESATPDGVREGVPYHEKNTMCEETFDHVRLFRNQKMKEVSVLMLLHALC